MEAVYVSLCQYYQLQIDVPNNSPEEIKYNCRQFAHYLSQLMLYFCLFHYGRLILEKSLSLELLEFGKYHRSIKATYFQMGDAYRRLDQNDKAHKCYEEAYEIAQRIKQPEPEFDTLIDLRLAQTDTSKNKEKIFAQLERVQSICCVYEAKNFCSAAISSRFNSSNNSLYLFQLSYEVIQAKKQVCIDLKEWEECIKYVNEQREIMKENQIQWEHSINQALLELTAYYIYLDRYDEADKFADKFIKAVQKSTDHSQIAFRQTMLQNGYEVKERIRLGKAFSKMNPISKFRSTHPQVFYPITISHILQICGIAIIGVAAAAIRVYLNKSQ